MDLIKDYSGSKTIQTLGGSTLTNSNYTSPAKWGNAGAWELYKGTPQNQNFSYSGRRIWNLSFSFMANTDLFAKYNSLNKLIDNDETEDDNETLLTSNNFYSQVIHKTAGNLPFIFQPDNTINDYAICRFDQKSFQFTQTAPSLYSVKTKIIESW